MRLGHQANSWGGVVGHPVGVTSIKDLFYLTPGDTLATVREVAAAGYDGIELFPQLEQVKVLRSWTGLCDLSPDYSPILGKTEVDNFHISAGWGTYGFKAAPIVGQTLAELVATGKQPELIQPFALERFYEDKLVSELAAAAVSH